MELQRWHIFEFGDKSVRLLAYLARPDYVPVHVAAIRLPRGGVGYSLDILQTFVHFYRDLYASRASASQAALSTYLSEIDLPGLSDEDWGLMVRAITF